MNITIKSKSEIDKMRKAGKLASEVLLYIKPFVKEGVSTEYINQLCHDFIIKNNAIPAPLNYHGFPKSVCTSINDVVCHGIPNNQDILKNGDIVNVDVTVILDGYHGDTSTMFMIGDVSEQARLLVHRTKDAMMEGINVIKSGIYLYEVGRAIENYIRPFKYSIVRDYCGHGIGKGFHEDPNVLHYFSLENKIKLKKGMIFTVEPMVNIGGFETEVDQNDGWTVRTKDGSLSAQFEHTVLVTKNGFEILTI